MFYFTLPTSKLLWGQQAGLHGVWGFLPQFEATVKPGLPSWCPGDGSFSGLSSGTTV